MSFAIPAIGAVPPIFAPPVVPSHGPNPVASQSAAETTLAAESAPAAVVYEPSPSEEDQSLTYSNPDPANRLLPPRARADDQADDDVAAKSEPPAPVAVEAEAASQSAGFAGDAAVVAATGGTVLPPAQLPETPRGVAVERLTHEIWAPVGLAAPDATPVLAVAQPTPQVGQAEAHAQASYAAVAEAMVAGASLADLPKFA